MRTASASNRVDPVAAAADLAIARTVDIELVPSNAINSTVNVTSTCAIGNLPVGATVPMTVRGTVPANRRSASHTRPPLP